VGGTLFDWGVENRPTLLLHGSICIERILVRFRATSIETSLDAAA